MFDSDKPASVFASPSPPADAAASPSPAADAADPAARGRVRIYEPEDCDERWRQHLERTPRHTGPTLIPIQV